jgi:hypothetical protein
MNFGGGRDINPKSKLLVEKGSFSAHTGKRHHFSVAKLQSPQMHHGVGWCSNDNLQVYHSFFSSDESVPHLLYIRDRDDKFTNILITNPS